MEGESSSEVEFSLRSHAKFFCSTFSIAKLCEDYCPYSSSCPLYKKGRTEKRKKKKQGQCIKCNSTEISLNVLWIILLWIFFSQVCISMEVISEWHLGLLVHYKITKIKNIISTLSTLNTLKIILKTSTFMWTSMSVVVKEWILFLPL